MSGVEVGAAVDPAIGSRGRLHELTGLGPRSMNTYLAALGLVRVLGEQVDPQLRAWWSGDTFFIDIGLDDLAGWLVEEYRPAPIVSPWNGGSGFGEKDGTSRVVLEKLAASRSARLADIRTATEMARRVVDLAQLRGWDKPRIVGELRNRAPETLLPWLDASVVLRDQGPAFPPLLGTGGNDGRFDFSTNFHQRLGDVLPELGADEARSRAWAERALRDAGAVRLVRAAVGQFDPGSAGGRNSSPFGAAESLVNPWQFILLLEGAMCFASSVVRRQGAVESRAAMPFCVFASNDGPTPGADGEDSRGEIWAPVWLRPLTAREIMNVFVESRASWQGEPASRAAQMYAAVHSYGVARGLDIFIRYGLHKRNGLAFSAVRLDEIEVRADHNVELSVLPESVRRAAFVRVTSGAVRQALRRFDRSQLAFVRTVRAEPLRDMLTELTRADLAVQRSAKAQAELGRRPMLGNGSRYLAFLHDGLPAKAELRVASGLASARFRTDRQTMTMRDLLVGRVPQGSDREWQDPIVRGLGIRPLDEVLADVVRWRSWQPDVGDVDRGFLPVDDAAVRVPWSDLHAWVEGLLDEEELRTSFLACLALDWHRARHRWADPLPGPGVVELPPNPELAVLQALASGRVGSGSKPPVPTAGSEPAVVDGPNLDVVRHGLDASWPSRLVAEDNGRDAHRRNVRPSPVITEAVDLLKRAGWSIATPWQSASSRTRLVAALVAISTLTPLRRLGAHLRDEEVPSDESLDPDEEGVLDA